MKIGRNPWPVLVAAAFCLSSAACGPRDSGVTGAGGVIIEGGVGGAGTGGEPAGTGGAGVGTGTGGAGASGAAAGTGGDGAGGARAGTGGNGTGGARSGTGGAPTGAGGDQSPADDRCDQAVYDASSPPGTLALTGSLGTHDPSLIAV